MNEETNAPEERSVNRGTGSDNIATTANNAGSGFGANNEISAPQDDHYYEVDYAKKDVLSTIGDGEMHDEGLVGAGEVSTDIQSSTERMTDEQDEAESHDSEQ